MKKEKLRKIINSPEKRKKVLDSTNSLADLFGLLFKVIEIQKEQEIPIHKKHHRNTGVDNIGIGCGIEGF